MRSKEKKRSWSRIWRRRKGRKKKGWLDWSTWPYSWPAKCNLGNSFLPGMQGLIRGRAGWLQVREWEDPTREPPHCWEERCTGGWPWALEVKGIELSDQAGLWFSWYNVCHACHRWLFCLEVGLQVCAASMNQQSLIHPHFYSLHPTRCQVLEAIESHVYLPFWTPTVMFLLSLSSSSNTKSSPSVLHSVFCIRELILTEPSVNGCCSVWYLNCVI